MLKLTHAQEESLDRLADAYRVIAADLDAPVVRNSRTGRTVKVLPNGALVPLGIKTRQRLAVKRIDVVFPACA